MDLVNYILISAVMTIIGGVIGGFTMLFLFNPAEEIWEFIKDIFRERW